MKKATLTMSFNKEKLGALSYYMEKKEVDLQSELADTIQKLYEKYVPQPTREYIEDRIAKEQKSFKPKKAANSPLTENRTQ